jgi:hypothetical protein
VQSIRNTPGDRQRVIEYDMKDGDWRGELRSQIVLEKPSKKRVRTTVDDTSHRGPISYRFA